MFLKASSVTAGRWTPLFPACSAIQPSFLLTHSLGRNVVTNKGACVNDSGENGPAIMYGYWLVCSGLAKGK
jgi:hypothetical protein